AGLGGRILHHLHQLAEFRLERGELVRRAGRGRGRFLDQDLLVGLEPLDAGAELLVLLPLGIERHLEGLSRLLRTRGAVRRRLAGSGKVGLRPAQEPTGEETVGEQRREQKNDQYGAGPPHKFLPIPSVIRDVDSSRESLVTT